MRVSDRYQTAVNFGPFRGERYIWRSHAGAQHGSSVLLFQKQIAIQPAQASLY